MVMLLCACIYILYTLYGCFTTYGKFSVMYDIWCDLSNVLHMVTCFSVNFTMPLLTNINVLFITGGSC